MTAAEILAPVQRSFEAIISASEPHNGLFPSILDRRSGKMLDPIPAGIQGQRGRDRAQRGNNLIHDEPTLAAMYGLSAAIGNAKWAEAADRYLKYFANECTNTVSGLFPWGEHSYFDFVDRRAGDSRINDDPVRPYNPYHDHLRAAPLWLWEKLLKFNRKCVERFAEGLKNHWTEGTPREYIRHALIQKHQGFPRGKRSCDFPRHGGFYIFDWSVAYLDTGRQEFLDQINTMLDYWWEKRTPAGMLYIASRMPKENEHDCTDAPGQTLSLASSLLESANLLADRQPALAGTMRQRAQVYIEAVLKASHDRSKGEFLLLERNLSGMAPVRKPMPVWGSTYGEWPLAYGALNIALVYRLTKDKRLLDWCVAAGENYIREPFPRQVTVPAMDAGLALDLLNEIFELTGEKRWLDAAQARAAELIALYCDTPLPRGAAGIDFYDSQMGPGFLLHGLARTALLMQHGSPCALPGDYTCR
jgi:hypothetical protein